MHSANITSFLCLASHQLRVGRGPPASSESHRKLLHPWTRHQKALSTLPGKGQGILSSIQGHGRKERVTSKTNKPNNMPGVKIHGTSKLKKFTWQPVWNYWKSKSPPWLLMPQCSEGHFHNPGHVERHGKYLLKARWWFTWQVTHTKNKQHCLTSRLGNSILEFYVEHVSNYIKAHTCTEKRISKCE